MADKSMKYLIIAAGANQEERNRMAEMARRYSEEEGVEVDFIHIKKKEENVPLLLQAKTPCGELEISTEDISDIQKFRAALAKIQCQREKGGE